MTLMLSGARQTRQQRSSAGPRRGRQQTIQLPGDLRACREQPIIYLLAKLETLKPLSLALIDALIHCTHERRCTDRSSVQAHYITTLPPSTVFATTTAMVINVTRTTARTTDL